MTKFSEVPMNKTFTYRGVRYVKDRQDKAQEYGKSTVRVRFDQDDEVEYTGPAMPKPYFGTEDEATDAQYRYLVALRVNLKGQRISKRQASQLINAAKSGDGVGMFGFEFYSGSN